MQKELTKQNVDANELSSMLPKLGYLLNKSSSKDSTKIATSLLDADNDGDIMDDVGNLVKGLFKKTYLRTTDVVFLFIGCK